MKILFVLLLLLGLVSSKPAARQQGPIDENTDNQAPILHGGANKYLLELLASRKIPLENDASERRKRFSFSQGRIYHLNHQIDGNYLGPIDYYRYFMNNFKRMSNGKKSN